MRSSGRIHLLSVRHWRWAAALGLLLVVAIFAVEQTELRELKPTWVGWREKAPSGSSSWADDDMMGEEVVIPEAKGRILITGGGGNIGKLLVRRLLSSHTPLTVLDLIFHSDEIATIHRELPQSSSLLKVVYGDVRDQEALAKSISSDVVGVINLAAVSRVAWCLENEADCADVNVRGTKEVLDAMSRHGKEGTWFIQASSREVYGIVDEFPVHEDTPHNPANAYGSTKAEAEDAIYQFASETPLPAILLRLSNVYGGLADHHERLIPSIMTNALAHRPIQIVGGDQDLDMVHIDDVIDAFALSINRLEAARAEHNAPEIEVFNIGTGGSTPAFELIRKTLALTNSSSPIQRIPGDVRFPDYYVGSTVRASVVLGYESRVTQDQGLYRLALAFLDTTVDFLVNKLETDCSVRDEYSISDLLKLDGCTGTLGVDGPGRLEYLYQVEVEATGENPVSWEWRDEDEPQTWRFSVKPHRSDQVLLQFSQTKSNGEQSYFEAVEAGRLLGSNSEFIGKIDRYTGYVELSFAKSEKPLVPPHMLGGSSSPVRFRLTPFCCEGKSTPWPFFKDDPLASAINDQRFETVRYFDASHRKSMCKRLDDALTVTRGKIDRLHATYSAPITLEQAPLPTGSPPDWRFRNLDPCSNLCDHPTICLDTGDCACALDSCSRRIRFPFTSFANVPGLSYPAPTLHWDDLAMHDPDILVKQVAGSSWLNVLRPTARRYLQGNPAFHPINLTKLPDEWQKDRDGDPNHYDQVQSTWHGCFSADSVMERGVKALSTEYTPDSLVFMPYYAGTRMMDPPVEPWVEFALNHNLPPNFDTSRMIVPFTFDWGVCNTVLRNLFKVRDWSYPPREVERVSAWQPMGDLNSPCYRMDQDIVIPARTCLQEQLREAFGGYGDVSRVKPCRQRSVLVAFKGSLAGAGSSLRQKITCNRRSGELNIEPKLVGGNLLSKYWNELKPGANYIDTIGDTVFCPVPRGTTGWATRTIDVIYAGCIPVRMGDQTHHPFWDMLDWNKFSIQIDDDQIENLEDVLLSYTWGEIQQMQTNLMLIRDAFLYPAEDNMGSNTRERGPFFYAMHGTALLRQTRFPV